MPCAATLQDVLQPCAEVAGHASFFVRFFAFSCRFQPALFTIRACQAGVFAVHLMKGASCACQWSPLPQRLPLPLRILCPLPPPALILKGTPAAGAAIKPPPVPGHVRRPASPAVGKHDLPHKPPRASGPPDIFKARSSHRPRFRIVIR